LAITRVYILAKELGVKSKAIVEKCQAEGLDIKNHMATISAGLAATIREWFSEGEHATTVETAKRVDLKRVRVRKKKRKVSKKKAARTTQKSPSAGAAAAETESKTVVEAEAVTAEKVAKTAKAAKKIIRKKKTEATKKVKKAKKVKPEPVIPAGPMLDKPKPARLNGPRVVRVEAPEPTRRTKPKPKPKPKPKAAKPRYDGPVTEPLMLNVDIAKGTLGTKDVKGKRPRGTGKDKRRRRNVPDEEVVKQPTISKRMRQLDLEERRARLDAAVGQRFRSRPLRRIETSKPTETVGPVKPAKVTISEPITVKDLSAALAVKIGDVIGKLMQQDVIATANQSINTDVAELIALEFGTELIIEKRLSIENKIQSEFAKRPRTNQQKRPAIVTMLGHVDHGKTSLLDRIRQTDVVAGEAGGITQHIGAYQISWDDKRVTFLDTPGHEAFTAMRARGANITDVVVLVVAADDGVMPQTIEAINHARAAGVPIIVALNKIDLPGCDTNRIYGQLAEYDLAPAQWGGQTEVVETSAVTGKGVEDLLEYLDYTSELLELRADNDIPATGWVVEARMTPQRGPVATVLIKEGKLQKGDIVLAGGSYGRVRILRDSHGKVIKKAVSAMPVEIVGLNDVPRAGEKFYCLGDINMAKEAAEENQALARQKSLAQRSQVTLENLFSQIEAGSIKELNVIIRADVQGSVDVLIKYLSQLSTDEIKVKILHSAVGGITEGDVVLAKASGAIVIGFNVVPEDRVRQIAEDEGVDIRLYNVIYRITEDLKKAMAGLLEPEKQEKALGRVTIRNTFKVSGIGTIAGCYVASGVVVKNARLRLIRDNIVIKDNCIIESLRHFKDDVREVRNGFECGIKVAGFDDVKIDDVFEVYEIVEVARSLD